MTLERTKFLTWKRVNFECRTLFPFHSKLVQNECDRFCYLLITYQHSKKKKKKRIYIYHLRRSKLESNSSVLLYAVKTPRIA